MHDDLNNIEFEILETIRQVATLPGHIQHAQHLTCVFYAIERCHLNGSSRQLLLAMLWYAHELRGVSLPRS